MVHSTPMSITMILGMSSGARSARMRPAFCARRVSRSSDSRNGVVSSAVMAPEFFAALHEGSRSTRIEDARDTLVAVVNDVSFEFSFDPSQIETLWANVGPRMAITARVHALRSIDRLRHAVRQGIAFRSSLQFLDRLLRDQGDVMVRIVRQATLQVDEVEDKLLVGRLGLIARDDRAGLSIEQFLRPLELDDRERLGCLAFLQ